MNTKPVVMYKAQMDKYKDLTLPKPIATYMWIDSTGTCLRSRERTLNVLPQSIKECPSPRWYFDDSLRAEAPEDECDVYLKPDVIYNNPFYRDNSILILATTYNVDGPTLTNQRVNCVKICLKSERAKEPWFGFNQEFVIMSSWKRPLGWPRVGYPKPESHYCATGVDKIPNRDLMNAFVRCCLFANINIYGINSGSIPSIWNFQVGPSPGIKAADDLWAARYILSRLAEEYGTYVSYECYPVAESKGNKTLMYFSTRATRVHRGLQEIYKIIQVLENLHKDHVSEYNNLKDDEGRISKNIIGKFTAGVGDRSASIRIPKSVEKAQCGYMEDRRAPSNADPYRLINRMLNTCFTIE